MDSKRYADFLLEISELDGRLREDPPEDLPEELELQSLWFSGVFGSDFTDSRGRPIRIRDLGHWNHAAGPDFTDAAIEIGGEILRGAIEMDVDVRDWEQHGHGANPDFEGTILHLSFDGPDGEFFVRDHTHREIPRVRLSLGEALGQRPRRAIAEAHLGRCAQPLAGMEAGRLDDLVQSAARYRLDLKSRRINRIAHYHGRSEALFQGVAEVLGYRPNKLPMRVLAQRLPLGFLRTPKESREALLFGVGGFLDDDPATLEGETKSYLLGLWETWWKLRSEYGDRPELPWSAAGCRPGNHPQRRVAALAVLIGRWPTFSRLVDSGDLRKLGTFCAELEHPYWSTHYTLRAQPAQAPVALIGKSRSLEMLANVLFPLLIPDRPKLWEDYLGLPATGKNQKVRRAALRLFGEDGNPSLPMNRIYRHQGLLQIFEDFCMVDDSACEDCPFPEQLKFW